LEDRYGGCARTYHPPGKGDGQLAASGITADLTNTTRSVLEDVSYRLRRMESNHGDN
jgi:hypothetical protein